jgi:hypothetical protein
MRAGRTDRTLCTPSIFVMQNGGALLPWSSASLYKGRSEADGHDRVVLERQMRPAEEWQL